MVTCSDPSMRQSNKRREKEGGGRKGLLQFSGPRGPAPSHPPFYKN